MQELILTSAVILIFWAVGLIHGTLRAEDALGSTASVIIAFITGVVIVLVAQILVL